MKKKELEREDNRRGRDRVRKKERENIDLGFVTFPIPLRLVITSSVDVAQS